MIRRAGEWAVTAWEQVFGPDPGLLRLGAALRVTLSAAVILTVLLLLQHVAEVPNAAVGLGLMVGIFGSMTLQDPTPAQQRVTLLLLPLPALAGAAAGAFLSRWTWVPEVGFVLVVLGASLARMLGPRGMTFGMIGYIAYFLGIIMRPPLSQFAIEAAAVGIAVAAAYAVRFHLVRAWPELSLRHILLDTRHRIARLLGEIEAALGAGDWGSGRQHRLHRDMARLNDAMLAAEQQIESLGGRRARPAVQASRLGPCLLELELTAERVVRAATAKMPDAGSPNAARRQIAALREALLAEDEAAPLQIAASAGSNSLGQALDSMRRALAALPAAGQEVQATQPSRDAAGKQDDGQPRREEDQSGSPWRKPALCQSVQVAVAVALAVALGGLIPGGRWYWAAVAAFITCIGVSSRGEAFTKGLQRIAGTLIGVAAGIFLASAVSGHAELALALILVCVFFAFYAYQAAHGVMIFWITIMLALLYGLLGGFKPELLWLRLEETAAGVVIGVLVAMLVLPVRSRDVFRSAVQDFLKALSETVRQTVARLCDPVGNSRPLFAARELDQRMQALRRAIGPLKRGWIALIPVRIRQAVRIAMQSAYLARELAHAAETRDSTTKVPQAEAVRSRADALLRDIEALRGAIQSGRKTAGPSPWSSPAQSDHVGGNAEAGWELAIGSDAAALQDPLRLLDGLADALRQFRQRVTEDAAER